METLAFDSAVNILTCLCISRTTAAGTCNRTEVGVAIQAYISFDRDIRTECYSIASNTIDEEARSCNTIVVLRVIDYGRILLVVVAPI